MSPQATGASDRYDSIQPRLNPDGPRPVVGPWTIDSKLEHSDARYLYFARAALSFFRQGLRFPQSLAVTKNLESKRSDRVSLLTVSGNYVSFCAKNSIGILEVISNARKALGFWVHEDGIGRPHPVKRYSFVISEFFSPDDPGQTALCCEIRPIGPTCNLYIPFGECG